MPVSQQTLRKYKWGDLALRPYQLDGVNWLLSCYDNNHGCILSDEMGLGKTCQVIAMLTVIQGKDSTGKQHLVVCPRSVLENWELEIQRFSSALNVIVYIGEKETRGDIARKLKAAKARDSHEYDVLLTTYEMCLKDNQFLSSISWDTIIVDEGHRLKNSDSMLYTTLEAWNIRTRILLTGTPLQNNLRELYALLSFVDSSKFKLSRVDKFVDKFSTEDKDVSELHDILAPYILRRTKANVLADLPEKNDVLLYHGLSGLQKKLYKAILTKDLGIFESNTGSSNQTGLMNILMQLRKCVNHPYLFDGVEPEPFELGEHLVEASHKLALIDRLLEHLKEAGHKVLMFSQMSRMLDILQDYLGYRGYTYERLDGSVRGEERFLAVQNFNANDETFVFLLSTKAGGQGLNLTSADTVIFVDSDFNPQNDLQAAARAHRIGQERPVKIIRLVGRHTVEEIILHRAEEKLRLTEKVIDSADFTTASTSKQATVFPNTGQLREILKFGVEELLAEGKTDEPVDFEAIIGTSNNGQWVIESKDKHKVKEDVASSSDEEDEKPTQSMYVFEGTDYSKQPSAADIKAFEQLIIAEKEALHSKAARERTLRRTSTSIASLFLPVSQRKSRKQLTPEELEEKKKKSQEAAEKRALLAEERQLAKAEEQKKKREALWKANKYISANIILDSEGEDEDEEECIDLDEGDGSDEEGTSAGRQGKKVALKYVIGDVTHPLDALTDDNIIIHCVDNSGTWGRGGLFSAISARSPQPESQYELAGEMKDLTLGDCHLIPIDDIESREGGHDFLALIVSQHREKRTNKLSGIKLPALKVGLEKVYKAAKEKNASVHLPRIGHDTPGFNWYGTERLLQKHLSSKGIPTYIYYFPRKQAQKRKYAAMTNQPSKVPKGNATPPPSVAASCSTSSPPSTPSSSTATATPSPRLPALFSGIGVYFHNISEDSQKKLKRFLVAYDGDVEKRVNHSTTHLVTDASTNKLELNDLVKDVNCRVVTQNWLEDCVSKGKLLPTEDYLISLS